MSRKGLSQDMALRIGLATRALPEVDAQTLVEKLVAHCEVPLTAKKFEGLTSSELKTMFGDDAGEFTQDDLDNAVAFLKGEAGVAPLLPKTEPYKEGDMPGSIRVAVASNGGEMLDGHFASGLNFLIYQVSADEIRLIDCRPTDAASEAEDKTAGLVEMIKDCHVLFVISVGGPAAAKVVKGGIHPIKRPAGGPAREVLAELQPVLAGSPPPWLAKVLGVGAEARVRFNLEEEDA